MLLPSLLKSGDQVYQKVINQLYQKMLLLNLLITYKKCTSIIKSTRFAHFFITLLSPSRSYVIITHSVHRLFTSSLLDDKTILNVIFLKHSDSKKEYI